MIHTQAVRFIGKRVRVILEDTSVAYGTLASVTSTIAKILLDDGDYALSHIKHVYPA